MGKKGNSTREQRFKFQKITVTVKKQSKATDYWNETLTADSKRIFAGKNWYVQVGVVLTYRSIVVDKLAVPSCNAWRYHGTHLFVLALIVNEE